LKKLSGMSEQEYAWWWRAWRMAAIIINPLR
jgi:hypothetical protein